MLSAVGGAALELVPCGGDVDDVQEAVHTLPSGERHGVGLEWGQWRREWRELRRGRLRGVEGGRDGDGGGGCGREGVFVFEGREAFLEAAAEDQVCQQAGAQLPAALPAQHAGGWGGGDQDAMVPYEIVDEGVARDRGSGGS